MELFIRGKKMLYSPESHDLIKTLKIGISNGNYCVTQIDGRTVKVHRLLMNAPKGMVVDHINRNTLDNRLDNLRICTYRENGENKSKQNGTSSDYIGVSIVKRKKGQNLWRSKIIFKGRELFLGNYSTEIEAAKAYDLFIVHQRPNCYNINFPDDEALYLFNDEGKKFTPYIGVTFKDGEYVVDITDRKFKTAVEGAKFRDNYVVSNNTRYKTLNFPKDYPNFRRKIRTFMKKIDGDNTKCQLLMRNCPSAYVIIDVSDYDKIKHIRFCLDENRVISYEGLLHRIIMNVTDPLIYVDHIDRNPLNNCKSNLRISDPKKNAENRSSQKNSSSRYVGVSLNKTTKKWIAYVNSYGKALYSKTFDTEHGAALGRDQYILTHLPESHYTLNILKRPCNEAIDVLKIDALPQTNTTSLTLSDSMEHDKQSLDVTPVSDIKNSVSDIKTKERDQLNTYLQEGKSYKQIAKLLNVSSSTIRTKCKNYKLDHLNKFVSRNGTKYVKNVDISKDELQHIEVDCLSFSLIANIYDCSIKRVRLLCKKYALLDTTLKEGLLDKNIRKTADIYRRRKEQLETYLKEGKSYYEIAKLLKVCHKTVVNLCRKYELTHLNKYLVQYSKKIVITKKELQHYIEVEHLPFTQVAKMYNCSDNGLRRACKRYGIPF